VLRLPARALVSDLRKGGEPVLSDRIEVALDGVEPTVLLLMSPP
jgi:hypothetical protein